MFLILLRNIMSAKENVVIMSKITAIYYKLIFLCHYLNEYCHYLNVKNMLRSGIKYFKNLIY